MPCDSLGDRPDWHGHLVPAKTKLGNVGQGALTALCPRPTGRSTELVDLAAEGGVTIAPNLDSLSKLAKQYLSGHGGYLTYAIINSAGAHARAVHGFLIGGEERPRLSRDCHCLVVEAT